MKKIKATALLSSLTLLASTGYVQATTATATLNVKATVESSCKIEVASHIDFGIYVPDQDKFGQGTLRVTCIKGDAPIMSLLGGGDNVADRELANGTETIAYSLYQPTNGTTACVDTSLTKLWGANPGAGTAADPGNRLQLLTFTTGYVAQDYSVCGKIAKGQNTLSKGTYTGTVTAQIDY
ncbi:MAG: spore coat U domain-containing protein [bacterium]